MDIGREMNNKLHYMVNSQIYHANYIDIPLGLFPSIRDTLMVEVNDEVMGAVISQIKKDICPE